MGSKVPSIDDMNFDELKVLLQNKYKGILPRNAFDSPEKLYEALEAFQKHTGYSHIFNARAYRILEAAVHLHLVFTCRDLANYSGLSLHPAFGRST